MMTKEEITNEYLPIFESLWVLQNAWANQCVYEGQKISDYDAITQTVRCLAGQLKSDFSAEVSLKQAYIETAKVLRKARYFDLAKECEQESTKL